MLQLKCIAPMNLSNGGRLSKREIHYQFLKREKDPNKTLNKYFVGHDFTKNCTMISPKFVPWFHYIHTSKWSYLHFIESIIVLWLFFYLPFTLSIINNEMVTKQIVIRQWLIEWKGHITFWRRGCNEITIQLLERWEICFPFCTGL